MRRSTLIAWIREVAATGAPLTPATWDVVGAADRWWTVYPLGREARPEFFFHARTMVRQDAASPPRALFVIVGPAAALQVLADRIAADGLAFTKTWATLAAFRADATAPATTIRASWPDERPRDGAGQPIGTEIVRLFARMASFDDDDAEE